MTTTPARPRAIVYDDDTVRAKLTDFTAAHGYATAARMIGVPAPNLHAMRKGERPVSEKVLAALGLRRAIVSATEGR